VTSALGGVVMVIGLSASFLTKSFWLVLVAGGIISGYTSYMILSPVNYGEPFVLCDDSQIVLKIY
jgi:hypothetical protein